MRATIIAAAVVLAFSVNNAFAVSLAVKLACKDDYFAHCSMHSPGSPGVRKCMRAVGSNLSPRCIGALADAGEITKAVQKKYYAKKQSAQTKIAYKAVSKKQYAQKAAAKRKYAAKADARRKIAHKESLRKQAALKELTKRNNERKNYTRLAAED